MILLTGEETFQRECLVIWNLEKKKKGMNTICLHLSSLLFEKNRRCCTSGTEQGKP